MKQLTPGQISWRIGIIKSYDERQRKVYSPNLKQWFQTRIDRYQDELMEHNEAQHETN